MNIKKLRQRDYRVINPEIFTNKNISGLSKAIYAFLYTTNDGTTMHWSSLKSCFKEVESEILQSIKELKLNGYLTVERSQGPSGEMDDFYYEIFEGEE